MSGPTVYGHLTLPKKIIYRTIYAFQKERLKLVKKENIIFSSEVILRFFFFFTRKQKHIYQKKDSNKAAGTLEPL